MTTYPTLPRPLKQAERKILSFVIGWNQSGTKEQLATSFGEITPSHVRYVLYVRAVESLATFGWITDCGGYFHSIETTCSKCGEN